MLTATVVLLQLLLLHQRKDYTGIGIQCNTQLCLLLYKVKTWNLLGTDVEPTSPGDRSGAQDQDGHDDNA